MGRFERTIGKELSRSVFPVDGDSGEEVSQILSQEGLHMDVATLNCVSTVNGVTDLEQTYRDCAGVGRSMITLQQRLRWGDGRLPLLPDRHAS